MGKPGQTSPARYYAGGGIMSAGLRLYDLKDYHQFRNESEISESKGDYLITEIGLPDAADCKVVMTLMSHRDDDPSNPGNVHPNVFYVKLGTLEANRQCHCRFTCVSSAKGSKGARQPILASHFELILIRNGDRLLAVGRGPGGTDLDCSSALWGE